MCSNSKKKNWSMLKKISEHLVEVLGSSFPSKSSTVYITRSTHQYVILITPRCCDNCCIIYYIPASCDVSRENQLSYHIADVRTSKNRNALLQGLWQCDGRGTRRVRKKREQNTMTMTRSKRFHFVGGTGQQKGTWHTPVIVVVRRPLGQFFDTDDQIQFQ